MNQVLPEVEAEVQASLHRGDDAAAVLAFLKGYEKDVLSTLSGLLRDDQMILDVYSDFCENLCRDIRSYKGESPILHWGCVVARNSARRYLGKLRRSSRLQTPWNDDTLTADNANHATLPQPDAKFLWVDTNPYRQTPIKSRVAQLLDKLEPSERQMLELRLVQKMSWPQVTLLLMGELDAASAKRKEDALRRRWSRLVLKLEIVLAEDGRQRVRTLLNELTEMRRMLVEQWILKRRPWNQVCVELLQQYPDCTQEDLAKERRQAIEQLERDYPRFGLLPAELKRSGLLSSPRSPRDIPARDRRNHR
jgi:RNA polymerase sigma factor (sigma-70 family)